MRSRLPAVLVLLLSAFLLGPLPGGAEPSALASIAASGAAERWDAPAVHAGQDAALPCAQAAAGAPAAPMWPAVLPSGAGPDPYARPRTVAAGYPHPKPRPAARRAPARAPPSTTR
ncbi:hypothetical protein MF672_000805 [Actinomadura sp. ATCC 31491]|uniref:Uncharacterized protein n=1 Tax=Actinomadura luzonensis TaxID=2805427 RepID=A0ABT0FJ48_9ACTN|nr:hypothetical protein [Actinomadura luzonensis]MCK2212344.1 hypothetical protein [Actinomadura luzonensis]